MKANTLHKYDDVLTGPERFRLILAAMARHDYTETERLRATCPRKVYKMADADCTDLVLGSQRVASCFAVWFLYMATYALGSLGQFTQYQGTAEEGAWLEITSRYMEHLKGTYTGLLRFCEDERLDWQEVLAWWPPVLAHIALYQHVFDSDQFPVNEEEAASIHSLLRTWWESGR